MDPLARPIEPLLSTKRFSQVARGDDELPRDEFPRADCPQENDRDCERFCSLLERTILRETRGGIHDLGVEVTRQGIVLTGQCPTFYLKQMAQQAVMRLANESSLVNHIEVMSDRRQP